MKLRFFVILCCCLPALPVRAETFRIVLPTLPAEQIPVTETRRNEAETLFQQALVAVERRNGSEAMRLAVRALEFDPNHERIRTVLGFRLHDGYWRTGWEVDRLNKGFVDHPVFGWIPAENVRRYEAGRRLLPSGNWDSAEEDARLRMEIRNGWHVTSEHYDLLTDHSLEEGVRTVRRLEQLYRAWKLLFFNFLLTDDAIVRMFKGRPVAGMLPRHEVYLYRDKDDYVAGLKTVEPRIAQSSGFYYPRTRRAYFYPVAAGLDEFDAEVIRKTLYHEGTHQLFQEARLVRDMPGKHNNFWLVEGIAMLMETFRIEDGRSIVGDPTDIRLEAAYYNKFEEGFYLPVNNLVRLGFVDFQAHPKVTKVYSQSAALTHFLVFHDDGRYRDAVIKLLRLIYSGVDKGDSLSRLTGRSYKELDEEYERFLQALSFE